MSRSKFLLIISTLLLAILTGCTSTWRLYSGPKKSRDELCVLITDSWVYIAEINGNRYGRLRGKILLHPQKYEIVVGYHKRANVNAGERHGSHVKLEFTGEAGKKYLVRPMSYTMGNRWYPIVEEIED